MKNEFQNNDKDINLHTADITEFAFHETKQINESYTRHSSIIASSFYPPIFDYKRSFDAKQYDFSLMFMSTIHVSVIYGSLLKERNSIRTLLRHYEEAPSIVNNKIRMAVMLQAKAIDELIKEIEAEFENQDETKLLMMESEIKNF